MTSAFSGPADWTRHVWHTRQARIASRPLLCNPGDVTSAFSRARLRARPSPFAYVFAMAPPAVIGSQKPGAINTTAAEQKIGQATSVIIPLLELGALGYETYVLVYLICVKYLIDPSESIRRFNVQPRRSTGMALIVVYAILLLPLLASWLRLIQMIWSKPDLVPLGDSLREKTDASTKGFAFDQYDAYICDYQGTPLWCEKCHNWKPDRTHHCKELGRCVRKMDHYCPWAGGIIGESTHKFFMQFVAYAALYTTYVWIVIAVFLAEHNSKVSPIQMRVTHYGMLTFLRWAHAPAHGSVRWPPPSCSASSPSP
jgi:hypothetical protein